MPIKFDLTQRLEQITSTKVKYEIGGFDVNKSIG